MKRSTILKLLVVAGMLLQGCGTTVNPKAEGTRKMLKDSQPFSLSSTDCPRGVGVVRLVKNTMKGDQVVFNAKVALTAEPIKKPINVYDLIGENNNALLKNNERKTAKKIKISNADTSIMFIVSDDFVDPQTESKLGNTVLKNEEGKNLPTVKPGQKFGILYNAHENYYSGTDKLEGIALSEVDQDESVTDKKLANSIFMRMDGKYNGAPMPDPLEQKEMKHHFYEKYTAKVGAPLAIEVRPAGDDVANGKVYVQIYNTDKGAKNAGYNFITKDSKEPVINVPIDEVTPGDYFMNVFRSRVYPLPDDKGQAFCLDVNTGFAGMVTIAPADKAKK
jgi:hypothetical protein